MSRLAFYASLGAGLAMLAFGCSLDAGGTAVEEQLDSGATPLTDTSAPDLGADDTAPDSNEPPDTARDAQPLDSGPDVPPCDVSRCGTVPAGAKRVALVERGTACPSGFAAANVVELRDGTGCTCACSVATNPTCPGNGAISTSYSQGFAGCALPGPQLNSPASNTCAAMPVAVQPPDYARATAPGPTGGSCTPSAGTNVEARSRSLTLCEPAMASCHGDICNTPFRECIETAGACVAPFATQLLVGTSAMVACPACSCGLTATCAGTLSLYTTAGCTGTAVTLRADGVCAAKTAGTAATNLVAFKYAPDGAAGAVACTPSVGASPGTATLTGQRRLCCR